MFTFAPSESDNSEDTHACCICYVRLLSCVTTSKNEEEDSLTLTVLASTLAATVKKAIYNASIVAATLSTGSGGDNAGRGGRQGPPVRRLCLYIDTMNRVWQIRYF